MKYLKVLFVACSLLGVLTTTSCSSDEDKFISQTEVKEKINADMTGKVWHVNKFFLKETNLSTGATTLTPLNNTLAAVKKVEFRDLAAIVNGETRYAYDVTSIQYGTTVIPDPHVLTVRTEFASYFLFFLSVDYSELTAEYKDKSSDKVYFVTFTR
ncbi:hypothetical protein [Sphingobacterium thermophilum]